MRAQNRRAWLEDPSATSVTQRSCAHSRPRASRFGRRLTVLIAVATLFALLAVSPAAARTSESSLSLVLLDSADGRPNVGEQVTFDITTAAAQPFVNVRCYQGDAFVYDAWAGFFDGAWFGQTFTLSSTYWQSGDADCRARLIKYGRNGREHVLAHLPFRVFA